MVGITHLGNAERFFWQPLDLKFILNGEELPLKEMINDIEKQLEFHVLKKAEELINDNLSDITRIASEIEEDLKHKAFVKLGITHELEY